MTKIFLVGFGVSLILIVQGLYEVWIYKEAIRLFGDKRLFRKLKYAYKQVHWGLLSAIFLASAYVVLVM
ncbi:hypothetical protein [Pseudomonas phage vB_PaeP_TUMS_P10]|nr:hypothetical protein [Pseudomonas phage vB_PaeP_TUMS_P10]